MVQVITYYLFFLVSLCVKCRGTNLEGLQREDREVFRQPLAHTPFLVMSTLWFHHLHLCHYW